MDKAEIEGAVVKERHYEYMVRLTTLVPVDRADLCKEIVDNVYGPVTAEVVSHRALAT